MEQRVGQVVVASIACFVKLLDELHADRLTLDRRDQPLSLLEHLQSATVSRMKAGQKDVRDLIRLEVGSLG